MKKTSYAWQSKIAPLMLSFLEEKRAFGYIYRTDEWVLNRFDHELAALPHTAKHIPRDTVLKLMKKHPCEQKSNLSRRMTVLNEFLRYMLRLGYMVDLIPPRHIPVYHRVFKARIFAQEEIRALLAAADQFPASRQFPLLRYAIPLLFRMLVNMGLRLGEALLLKPETVDLEQGWLCLEQSKDHVPRLLPMSDEMRECVRRYVETVQTKGMPGSYFFPGTRSPHLLNGTVRTYFHQLLRQANILYYGRDGGPRIHDLRHAFAVQCLNGWIQSGVDLLAAMPILSKYMGHTGVSGTQRYLQLTAELYPEVLNRLESAYGRLIPSLEEGNHEAD